MMDRDTYLQIKEMARSNTPDLIRTYLANERTFLSFIRTSLTLFIMAFTLIRFVETPFFVWIGWVFVGFGIATFFVGLTRYIRMKTLIRAFNKAEAERHRESAAA
jgi:putative membrane protein